MAVDAARLRLVDLSAEVPAQLGAEARRGRAARLARRKTAVLGPSGLKWRVRIRRLPRAMTPAPPSELLAHADPAHGWTPLPLGIVVAAFALPLLPLVVLLRALGLLSWELEARTYPWGRRHPPIVFVYAVRGREAAEAALTELAEELARGSGAPVLTGAERVD